MIAETRKIRLIMELRQGGVLVDAIASPWRVDGLPPGHYRVVARAASGWSGAARITLTGDEPVRVDMVLGTSP